MYPNPADANLTDLLGLFLCGTGLILNLVWLGILCVSKTVHGLLPSRERRGIYWMGMLVFTPVLIFSVPCVARGVSVTA
jgi:hypothetical protein